MIHIYDVSIYVCFCVCTLCIYCLYEHMCELREKEITKRKKQAVYNYYKELGNGVELVLDITFTSEVTMHDLWHHTHNGGLGTVSDLPEGTTMRIR